MARCAAACATPTHTSLQVAIARRICAPLLCVVVVLYRFERWRREIWPDLNAQLDVWTQEVMGVLRAAESALVLQVIAVGWLVFVTSLAQGCVNPPSRP